MEGFIRPRITDKEKGIYGHVDFISSAGIGGWVIDVQSVEPRIVEVYINNERVGEALANLPRPDISQILGRDAKCGFYIRWVDVSLPSGLKWDSGLDIAVVDKLSGREIIGKHAKGRKPKFIGKAEDNKDEKHELTIEDKQIKEEYRIIKESGLFDEEWYLSAYLDVRRSGIDPIFHFVNSGWREFRKPSPFFDTYYYLNTYKDVKINPLVHFILYGWKEGRNPSSDFKTSIYLEKHPELLELGINPLKHFIETYDESFKEIVFYFNNFESKALKENTEFIKRHSDKCIFTIVSKNYFAYALTLWQSVRKNHPEVDFVIVLCDMVDELEFLKKVISIIENNNNILVISLFGLTTILEINELEEMLFKYNILEMNTAIKPFAIEFLFRIGYKKVIYLDPDILLMDRIDEVFQLLDKYSICLTPHILSPLPNDSRKPNDLDILKAGLYNLGFIALKNSDSSYRLLYWWQERLKDGCFMDVNKGYHVDQKWVDFFPIFADDVYIIKDKTYNVAYWNLHERYIENKDGKFYIDGKPIKFYHFSGFDLNNISKHQTRFNMSNYGVIKDLFNHYLELLKSNNLEFFKNLDYYFDKLPRTNIKNLDFVRKLHWMEVCNKFKNPYNPEATSKIIEYLNEDVIPGIKRIWYSIYNSRADLKEAFPDIRNNEEARKKFIKWVFDSTKREYNLHDIFLESSNLNKVLLKENIGVNLFGYFTIDIGMTIGAKRYLNLLKLLGIPYVIINVPAGSHKQSINNFLKFNKWFAKKPIYSINIIVVNADQIDVVNEIYNYRENTSYTIAEWAWEIENYFPFDKSYDYVDEIWYPSDFVVNTISKFAKKPVKKIPLFQIPDWNKILPKDEVRSQLGLSSNDYVFLFSFDFYSSFHRKNPDGVIKAFKNAFPKNIKNVKLILKTSHGEYFPKEFNYIKNISSDDERIIIIDNIFTRDEYISLLNACDAFISLHRSEGLGSNILEAMLLAKPVIATKYGGNLEFCTEQTSLLVDYVITEIKEDFGPYKKGCLWAEPDLDKASFFMQYLYENKDFGKELGLKAKQQLSEMYSKNLVEWMVIFRDIFNKIYK